MALISGCNPEAWLYGNVDTDRHGNMTTTAICPRLKDGEPDRPLIHAPPYDPTVQSTDIFIQATFDPSVQNITAQITKIGIPGAPSILIALTQALNDVAIDQADNQPYVDPVDTDAAVPRPNGILDKLTNTLDGTISASYSGGNESSDTEFVIQLGQVDQAKINELITQIAADFRKKETAINLDQIPNTDLWSVSIATQDDQQPIAAIKVSKSTVTLISTEDQQHRESEPAMPVQAEIKPHHFMLYMGPPTDTPTITDWWEPGYWLIYANTRNELEIEHTLTIGETVSK